MKKLTKLFMGLIIAVMFVACDNNDGPFEMMQENGHQVLYSDGKPAKGVVSNFNYTNTGAKVEVARIYMKDGIPAGDFTLFGIDGSQILEFKGKMVDDRGLFKGKLSAKFPPTIFMTNEINVSAEGEFVFDGDYIMNFDGTSVYYMLNNLKDVVWNGEFNDLVTGKTYKIIDGKSKLQDK